MDSLETVERVMFLEELLGSIPAKHSGSPREMVDWLERHLANSRPNDLAREMLRAIAENQQRPELAEGLDGTWRREQIAAIIREALRER